MEKGRNYTRKLLVLGTLGFVSLVVLMPIMEVSMASTRDPTQLEVEIIEPKEGYLYIVGKEIMPTFMGRTVMFGGEIYRGWHDTFHIGITIKAMVNDIGAGIQYVEFEINNEIMFMDTHKPYEWFYEDGNHVFGWNTIKVIAHDNEGNAASDEMNILLYMLKQEI